MSIQKPYHRFYRKFVGDNLQGVNFYDYMTVRDYAEQPEMYVRTFNMIQNDVQKLFEYVEPADRNLETYWMQIYNIFLRICVEVEANFKAILRENIYSKNPAWWNMEDYEKVNKTHHLSGYKVIYPVWKGERSTFVPFGDWGCEEKKKLGWYDVYNNCKHNKYQYMEEATFGTMLDAFAGLFVLLSSQFGSEDYAPGNIGISVSAGDDAFYNGEFGIGDYLQIVCPRDWTEDELYSFDWKKLRLEEERFQKYDYNQ